MYKMRSKQLLILVFILFGMLIAVQTVIDNKGVYLLTHQWCRKCDRIIKIVEKIKVNMQKENITNQQHGSNLKIELIHIYDDILQQNQHIQIKSTPKHNQLNSFQNTQKQLVKDQKTLKLQTIYKSIQNIYGLNHSSIPFPTLWIQSPHYTGFYQNQLTYSQLLYWLNLYSHGIIPICPQKQRLNKTNPSKDYQFQISTQDFEKYHSEIISFQLINPFIQFCLSHQNTQLKYSFLQLKQQIQQGPLFFSHFDHNLRNYLYGSSNKLAILIFFNNPSHPRVKQFIDIYKFISDSLNKNKTNNLNEGKISNIFQNNQSSKIKLQSEYHHSSIQNYDFKSKKQIYQNLVFVGACYNQNKRECMLKYEYSIETNKQSRKKDPSQKPILENYIKDFSFVGSKTQNLKKLLEFSHIKNIFQDKDLEEQKIKHSLVQIIAFNFDKESHQIKANIFDNAGVKLGNDFLFWLLRTYKQIRQQGLKNSQKDKQFVKSKCLSSQIIHYLSEKNLTVIKNNVKISKFVQRINQGQQKLINFKTVIIEKEPQKMSLNRKITAQKWKSQYFQICIKNKPMQVSDSYEETIEILKFLEQNNKLKSQFEQKQMLKNNQL